MRILFLGGTKFFGKLIVQELIKQNHDVTVVSRTVGWGDQIVGDRNSPDVLKQVTCHWDVVIDNIAYNANDVRTILKHVTTKHYILTSTIGVYYPNATDSDYAINKLGAEEVLYKSRNMLWTIMRLGVVYGPNDPIEKNHHYIKELIQGRPIPTSSNKVSFVFSEDIASAYLKVLDSGISGCFDLCHPTPFGALSFCDPHSRLGKIMHWNWSATRAEVGPFGYTEDFLGHPEHAMRFLDWKPTPWEEAVRKTIPWFQEQLKNEGSKSHP